MSDNDQNILRKYFPIISLYLGIIIAFLTKLYNSKIQYLVITGLIYFITVFVIKIFSKRKQQPDAKSVDKNNIPKDIIRRITNKTEFDSNRERIIKIELETTYLLSTALWNELVLYDYAPLIYLVWVLTFGFLLSINTKFALLFSVGFMGLMVYITFNQILLPETERINNSLVNLYQNQAIIVQEYRFDLYRKEFEGRINTLDAKIQNGEFPETSILLDISDLQKNLREFLEEE